MIKRTRPFKFSRYATLAIGMTLGILKPCYLECTHAAETEISPEAVAFNLSKEEMIQEIGKQQLDLLSHTIVHILKKTNLLAFYDIQINKYEAVFLKSFHPFLVAVQQFTQTLSTEEINILYAFHQPHHFLCRKDAIIFGFNIVEYIQYGITHVDDDDVSLPEWATLPEGLEAIIPKFTKEDIKKINMIAANFTPAQEEKAFNQALAKLFNDLSQSHGPAILEMNKISQENQPFLERWQKKLNEINTEHQPLIESTLKTIIDNIRITQTTAVVLGEGLFFSHIG